jgi:acetylornithine deacetylase/succinyl-diaminopimelate desuccinylase-like protein
MRLRPASLVALTALLLVAPAAAQPAPDPWAAKAREILARSVAFKSSAQHKETPALVAYLVGEFRAAGVRDDQINVLPVDATQALVVRIPGRDRAQKPILFSAHMDVVEANPADWERDPFTLIEDQGFFFGRGSLDDKAGVAQLATLIIRLSRDRLVPSRDLVFAFIGDEETTMRTTRLLAGDRKALIDAEFALNADAGGGLLDEATGKPVIYFIQGGEKTYSDFLLTVANPGGHSSAPRADNAIYTLAAALKRIEAHRFPVRSNALTLSSMRAEAGLRSDELGRAMAAFAANPADGPAAERLAREPSYVGQTRTTCVATMLLAGHAPNALPQAASANVNCRIWPGDGVEATRRVLEGVVADPAVRITVHPAGSIESPASPPRPDVEAAVRRALKATWGDVPIAYEQSNGATDGSHYRAAGIPTYGVTLIFMKDSDQFAHGLNERVPVASFDRATTGWWEVVAALADPRRAAR